MVLARGAVPALRHHSLGSMCVVPRTAQVRHSEGGTIRLKTLIELKFLDSNFSSLSSHWN